MFCFFFLLYLFIYAFIFFLQTMKKKIMRRLVMWADRSYNIQVWYCDVLVCFGGAPEINKLINNFVTMENNRASSMLSKFFSLIAAWFSHVYLRYELNTCTYMMEPWEKIFISILFINQIWKKKSRYNLYRWITHFRAIR